MALVIVGVLLPIGGAFVWMAHREVHRALYANGMERLRESAEQVSLLLSHSVRGRIADANRLAADPELGRMLRLHGTIPTEAWPASVRTFLDRNPQAAIAVYDGAQRLVGSLQARDAREPELPLPAARNEGVGALHVRNGRVWYAVSASIGGQAPRSAAGMLQIERPLGSATTVSFIERLMGNGTVLKLGNVTGGLWTDLSVAVPSPPMIAPRTPTMYTAADGSARLGISVSIADTPWLVWTDVSQAAILGPAQSLLQHMMPITGLFIVIGVVAVYAVSARATKRVEDLARAAEALAGGDYSQRVPVERHDEVGRLAETFNLMADRVSESVEALESRVQDRTRELDRARQELDRFFGLTIDLLCIAGIDGRFRRVNPAWETVLGWTADDLTSIPYVELVHPDDRAATGAEAAKLADGIATVRFENRYRCKDGSYRWLNWTAAPLLEAGLIYAAAHDVTEQKQSARALQQHATELAEVNHELEAFSYSVSHDLRTPLRGIDGFAQALAEDYAEHLDETGRDFLSRIRAAAQRMSGLIDDLLSLSRITRHELRRAPVDVSALVREIAARLQEQDPGRRVEWRVAPQVSAAADARLLRIALDNLLGNAWKFTSKHANAVIEFDARRDSDGVVRYVIRDNGAGFDMAHADKLFGAFQRLHGDADFAGTGIGLATVHRIVRRHGGRIWADARVGEGATFCFTLEA